jgi:hypothetical protein
MLGEGQGRSGRVRKNSLPPEFDPQTVESVASRYTDWAIPVHIINSYTGILSWISGNLNALNLLDMNSIFRMYKGQAMVLLFRTYRYSEHTDIP